jgi:rhamnogalacturonan endolyase
MEKLGRGGVAIMTAPGKAFVSWRLLESDDPAVSFNLYRRMNGGPAIKLNDQPLNAGTNFVDEKADNFNNLSYFVTPVASGKEAEASEPFITLGGDEKPYLSIPITTPEGYTPNDASVGDLDGDGTLDIVLHQVQNGQDNSHSGVTGPPILQAYKLDGTKLWEINLGRNIRDGAHYTQFMVYDLDGDGSAEIVCKTADGSTDGKGTVIGDATANYVNEAGKINSGPEFLTAFSGRDGSILSTVDYVPLRGVDKYNATPDEMKAIWGDGNGNRGDRFLAAVAYLDGQKPSVVMCRGYYTRTFLVAWDLVDGKLKQRWVFDSNVEGKDYAGQGNHQLSVADVDEDGKDEIVYGGMVVDDNGKGLYTTKLGHGDAMHVSDLDPSNPGLELVRIQERFDDAGLHMVALKTGEVLWRIPSTKAATEGGDKGEGPGRGASFDIDPNHPGSESWAFGAGMNGLFDAKGKKISDKMPPSCNFAVWWDGDETRELLDGTKITKWNPETLSVDPILDAATFGCVKNNGTKSTPTLSGDLLGDWREEVIWASEDKTELRLFTTTIPTDRRIVTLLQDPQYRLALVWQNVAYNQPPHPSFAITKNMPGVAGKPQGTPKAAGN